MVLLIFLILIISCSVLKVMKVYHVPIYVHTRHYNSVHLLIIHQYDILHTEGIILFYMIVSLFFFIFFTNAKMKIVFVHVHLLHRTMGLCISCLKFRSCSGIAL